MRKLRDSSLRSDTYGRGVVEIADSDDPVVRQFVRGELEGPL